MDGLDIETDRQRKKKRETERQRERPREKRQSFWESKSDLMELYESYLKTLIEEIIIESFSL